MRAVVVVHVGKSLTIAHVAYEGYAERAEGKLVPHPQRPQKPIIGRDLQEVLDDGWHLSGCGHSSVPDSFVLLLEYWTGQ